MEVVELYFNIKEKKQNLYQSFVLELENQGNLFGILIIENCLAKSRSYFSEIENRIKKTKDYKKIGFPELLQNLNDFIWRSPISNEEKFKFLIGLTKPSVENNKFSFQISCIDDFEIIVNRETALKNYFEKTTRFQKINEFEVSQNQVVWCLEQGLFEQLQTRNIFSSFLLNFKAAKTLSEQVKSFFKNTDIKTLLGIGLVIKAKTKKRMPIMKIKAPAGFEKVFSFLRSVSIPGNFVLPLVLAIFLAISLPLFGYERWLQSNLIKEKIEAINQDIKLGNFYLKNEEKERAKEIFLESWNLTQEIKKDFGSADFPETTILEKSAYQSLLNLSNFNEIKKLENVIKISPKQIAAENLVCVNDNLVLLSEYQQKIFVPKEEKTLMEKFDLFAPLENSLLLYENNSNLLKTIKFSESGTSAIETKKIQYEQEKEFSDLTSYLLNFYLLDKNSSIIWKGTFGQEGFYPYLNLNNIGLDFKPNDFRVDGSFWILNSEQKLVYRYRENKLKKIDLNKIFPSLANPAEIKTMPNYNNIYIADFLTKRIIAVNKTDFSFKQMAFIELPGIKDFCLSNDEKEIFILSENNIYKTKTPF
ncbi:MAG: hypothetical protein Q8O39_00390 [bacterium]|nr:hypothetical protein [bacterium]